MSRVRQANRFDNGTKKKTTEVPSEGNQQATKWTRVRCSLCSILPSPHRHAQPLSPNGNTLALRSAAAAALLLLMLLLLRLVLDLVGARLAVQEAALLDGAAGLHAALRVVLVRLQEVVLGVGAAGHGAADGAAAVAADGGRQVRDVLGDGVLGADGARVDRVGLAGLGEGVVAAVKVLALLEVLGEVVGARGELAVEAEEALLLGGEGLFRLGQGREGQRWVLVLGRGLGWKGDAIANASGLLLKGRQI